MGDHTGDDRDIPEEDALRAQCYGLLSRLLVASPTDDVLDMVGAITGDETELGQGLNALAAAARAVTAETIVDEYEELFIGVGRGELLPYSSYYLTGFLHEKPLAKLRIEMVRLGIAYGDDVKEPEDHIGALCEMMAGLITGVYGEPADLVTQQRFFDTHIGEWAPKFFEDLEAAKASAFYMPVGTIGRLFMEVEAQAFNLAA